ncbi:CD9 molecule b isoform X1 [Pimephales promelas]|uniref:CD9 antigen-like isoform X1 n=1 Tax=Pimephales promelas TaxID=90988 RepID=UPI001955C678|nr:CD9 antigen-like isoform X1 [Pimephales promelas]XP_039523764.1 CD9 molecule b isoform X1 [Pimephales promelas]KAG1952745.1 CD9 antigen [Pimephales promelas]
MKSGLSSAEQCIKYAIFGFNFIFWLAGTGVLAVGLWLRFDERTKELFTAPDSPSVFLTGVYILIVAGAVMMVVGFLGCCGAIKESSCMLGMFFVFLLVIFAAEVAAGIWGLSNKEKVVTDIQDFYKQTFDNYKNTNQEALRETLRAIHYGLNCCGKTGLPTDAVNDICPKKEGLEIIVTTSCPSAIEESFTSRLQVIGGVGIGIGVIMIFGMIFSMLLCCAIRRTRDIV